MKGILTLSSLDNAVIVDQPEAFKAEISALIAQGLELPSPEPVLVNDATRINSLRGVLVDFEVYVDTQEDAVEMIEKLQGLVPWILLQKPEYGE